MMGQHHDSAPHYTGGGVPLPYHGRADPLLPQGYPHYRMGTYTIVVTLNLSSLCAVLYRNICDESNWCYLLACGYR